MISLYHMDIEKRVGGSGFTFAAEPDSEVGQVPCQGLRARAKITYILSADASRRAALRKLGIGRLFLDKKSLTGRPPTFL